jgi:hypothetical protein
LTYAQVIKFFGTQVATAQAAGYTQPAVSNWKNRNGGSIPAEAQVKLSRASRGVLKISRSL